MSYNMCVLFISSQQDGKGVLMIFVVPGGARIFENRTVDRIYNDTPNVIFCAFVTCNSVESKLNFPFSESIKPQCSGPTIINIRCAMLLVLLIEMFPLSFKINFGSKLQLRND